MGARLNDEYIQPPGTVLATAIQKGDPAIIRALHDGGAAIVGQELSCIGNLETAVYLHEQGSLHDILNACGSRVLRAALLSRNDELARWLIDHGADVNNQSPRVIGTPLGAAIWTGNHHFTEVLLDRGARVTDDDLVEAVFYDLSTNSVSYLLTQRLLSSFLGGAPSALGLAICAGKLDLFQIILAAGADATGVPHLHDMRWRDGGLAEHDPRTERDQWTFGEESPPHSGSILELAAWRGQPQILKTVLDSHSWDKGTVGRALATAVHFHSEDLIEPLLKANADVNEEAIIYRNAFHDEDENENDSNPSAGETFTVLEAAVTQQRVSLVQRLLEDTDVDINHLGKIAHSRTALQRAVEIGNIELIDILLDHGADINSAPAEYRGVTALQIAAIKGYLGIARKLVDLGADVNAPGAAYGGRTALEGAAQHGRIDMIQMLLDNGASVLGDDRKSQYRNSVRWAKSNCHFAAVNILKAFRRKEQSS
ncbi:ankyrin repeat-containing domain protein [Aspergillus varians]